MGETFKGIEYNDASIGEIRSTLFFFMVHIIFDQGVSINAKGGEC